MQMPGDIGPVHMVGIGGIGMSAIAEILHAKGYHRAGQRPEGQRQRPAPARQGHPRVRRPRRRQPGRRALHRHLDGREAGQPRAGSRPRQGPADHPPRRDAGRADAALCDRLRHRHARQDHHDLAHRPRVQRGRPLDPTVITGGIINEWGSNARLGNGDVDDRRGRRIRRHLHQDPDPDRRRHQHRPGASRLLQDGREHAPRVRDLLPQHPLLRPGRDLHRPSRGARDDRAPAICAATAAGSLTYGTSARGRHRAQVGARRRCVDDLRRRSRRPRAGWRAHHPRLEHPAAGPPQCAQRAGCHRGRQRGRHRRRRDPQGHRRLLRRQAALPAHRHLERRVHLRRLRPPPRRDRRRAEGRPRRRARPRHRRGRAASLHARARSVPRVRRLLQGCRQRHRHAALLGRRAAHRWCQSRLAGGRHPRHRSRLRGQPSTASAMSCRCCAARPPTGDMVVCLGAGNSTEWAHALPDWLAREPVRAGGVA